MRVGIGNKEHGLMAGAAPCGLLGLAAVWVAGALACGGSSSSARDAAAIASSGGAAGSASLGEGGSPLAGTGGSSADATNAGDVAALAANCAYLPCLASAASTVAGCQPSSTCTYQTMTTTGAVVRCFDNGVTVIMNYPAAGMVVMGVKKAGAFCYGVDSINPSGAPNGGSVTYRDSNNYTAITIFADDAGGLHALCPDSNVSYSISPASSCMAAISSLGGITPGSACLYASESDCRY